MISGLWVPTAMTPAPAFDAAGAAVSALSVAASTSPVGGSPRIDWKLVTAERVPGPKIPSAPPATLTPAAMSDSWSVLTSGPVEPCLRPTEIAGDLRR